MNENIARLSRRDDLCLFGFVGLFLWILLSVGLDLFLGGRQFVQAFLEKCLAQCSALMTLSFSAAEGVRFILTLCLFALSSLAMVAGLSDVRGVRKFTRSLPKMEIPSRLCGLIRECGLRPDRVVLFPSWLSFACTAGLFSPRIFVSTQLFDSLGDEEVKAVLRHEQSHAQRKDPLRGMLIGLLTRFLFFIPPAVQQLRRVKRDLELVADSHCLAFSPSPDILASALVKMRRENLVKTRAITGFAGEDFLEERLHRLLNLEPRTPVGPRIRAGVLARMTAGFVLALSIAFLVFPTGEAFPKSSPWVCRHSSHEACCPPGGDGTFHAHCRSESASLTMNSHHM